MDWYVLTKFLHVVASIMFVGGIFARQLVRGYATRTNDVQLFAALSQAAGRVENVMVIPRNIAAIVLGVIVALIGGLPIFGFLQGASHNWLLVSLILLLLGLPLVPTVFIPRGKRFEPVLQAALAQGQITPELRAAMDDKVVRLAHLYEEVSLIIVVALMVLKPF